MISRQGSSLNTRLPQRSVVLVGVLAFLVIAIFFWAALPKMESCAYFLSLLALWALIGFLGRSFLNRSRKKPTLLDTWAPRIYFVVTGILSAALLIEIGLVLINPYLSPAKRLIPAPEWRFRMVNDRAYQWQGHLHRFNSRMFRGGEWPPPRQEVYRIIVFGDSLTFGYGVAEESAYPLIIQRELSKTYRVEVLNLGVTGFQSEDIVKEARQLIPELKPRLVIYGMCLNDFLPSGTAEYTHQRFIQLPSHFASHTALGLVLSDMYDRLLRKIGLKDDFYTDILRGGQPWSVRFEKDMRELNASVHNHGRPSVLALVLNQLPDHPKALELTALAESDMQHAGLNVVPAEPYIRQYQQNHIPLYVSRWEGHPNERAHDLFAQLLVQRMLSDPDIRATLEPFQKTASDR